MCGRWQAAFRTVEEREVWGEEPWHVGKVSLCELNKGFIVPLL